MVKIGSTFYWLKETDSTNNEALRILREENAENGMVILTEKQTAGRGQRGNIWKSKESENLTMSIILMPENLQIQYQFYLNMAVALGIHRALKNELGSDLQLKWANDIYFGSKKLGGILIENAVQKNNILHSVIGIGLNANQKQFDKNLPNPISLHQITARFYDLQTLAEQICVGIQYFYDLLIAGEKRQIRQDYLSVLLWKNEWRNFETDSGIIALKIIDVAPNGLLITENKLGEVLQFSFGELKAVL